jgi:hypothetical protein
METRSQIELTKEEKQAIMNCVEAIDCDAVDCGDCPFNYNCGCMLEHLREVAES